MTLVPDEMIDELADAWDRSWKIRAIEAETRSELVQNMFDQCMRELKAAQEYIHWLHERIDHVEKQFSTMNYQYPTVKDNRGYFDHAKNAWVADNKYYVTYEEYQRQQHEYQLRQYDMDKLRAKYDNRYTNNTSP